MKEVTVKLYEFDELSDEAKERVINEQRKLEEEMLWDYGDKIKDSMFSMLAYMGITVKDWSLGLGRSHMSFDIIDGTYDNYALPSMSGKRLYAWFENNLFGLLRIPFTGKQRWEFSRFGKAYRAGNVKPCPFTGVCYDEDFIQYINKSLKDGNDLETLLLGLPQEFKKLLNSEYDYRTSEEGIKEYLDSNDRYFTEEGEVWYQ
jgi:hypothetical protein